MDQSFVNSNLSRRRLLARTGALAAVAVSGVRLAGNASAASAATAVNPDASATEYAATAVPPVTAYGIDYAWTHPSISAMTNAGYKFAMRYLSQDPSKDLTNAEAQSLNAAGITVIANWEVAADQAKNGYNQGVSDATAAQKQAAACGMPPGRPIYFSCDWDVQSGDMSAVNAYFDGVASVIGAARAGAYSSYDALGWLLGSGRIKWAWQSESTGFSGGRNASPYPGIQLWQTGEFTFDGADCDKNEAFTADYGQWTQLYSQGSGGRIATGVHEDGRIDIFVVTPSGGIQHRYETAPDQPWSSWSSFGPSSGSVVAVAAGRHLSGRLEVFAVMSDGSMQNKYETSANGNWSGWNGFAPAGTAKSATVGVHFDGRLEVFAVTPSGGVENKYETAPDQAWSGWSQFGPSGVVDTLASARHSDGRVELFAVMSDGSIQNRYETAPNKPWSGWNGYAPAGTTNGNGSPGTDSAGVHLNGRMEVFAITPSGGIQNKSETTPDGSWSGWTGFGPSGVATATAVSQHKSGRLEVFAVMADGSIQNKYESAANGAWSGWNGFAPAATAKA